MHEIKCPNCGKTFEIDEAGYANILTQVRDGEFTRELQERLEMAEKDKLSAVKLAEEITKNQLQVEVAKKDSELAELKAQHDAAVSKLNIEKDVEIVRLQSKLEAAEIDKKLALTEAVGKLERERDELANKLQEQG
jgi:hypothetical protein